MKFVEDDYNIGNICRFFYISLIKIIYIMKIYKNSKKNTFTQQKINSMLDLLGYSI